VKKELNCVKNETKVVSIGQDLKKQSVYSQGIVELIHQEPHGNVIMGILIFHQKDFVLVSKIEYMGMLEATQLIIPISILNLKIVLKILKLRLRHLNI
jgi:hypothetical protein